MRCFEFGFVFFFVLRFSFFIVRNSSLYLFPFSFYKIPEFVRRFNCFTQISFSTCRFHLYVHVGRLVAVVVFFSLSRQFEHLMLLFTQILNIDFVRMVSTTTANNNKTKKSTEQLL